MKYWRDCGLLLGLLAGGAVAAGEPCGGQEGAAGLRAMQQAVVAAVPAEVASLRAATREGGPLAGYMHSHGDVYLRGMGVVLVGFDLPEPLPQLLFYEPEDQSNAVQWLDFDGEDGPYRLSGWGYVPERYRAGATAPAWPCIRRDQWFVHRAGWHLKDGGMRVTAGAEAEPERPEDPNIWYWHPAAWDIHIWLHPEGLPEVSLFNEVAMDAGLGMPEAAFFRPENP